MEKVLGVPNVFSATGQNVSQSGFNTITFDKTTANTSCPHGA